MAYQVFLCSSPNPPYPCTFVSSTPEHVITHLIECHSGIPQYRRRYGAAALTQLPIAATIQHQPAFSPALSPALPVFICDTCEVYFVHPRAYIEHLVTDPSHAMESAAAIDQMGEFNFEDAMLADRAAHLVLGSLPPPAPAPARSRLMVNFTTPYARDPCSVNIHATTTAELGNTIDIVYGRDNNPIDWAKVWNDGLVFRYTTIDNGAGRMVVKSDSDVVLLGQRMVFGECCIGDARRV